MRKMRVGAGIIVVTGIVFGICIFGIIRISSQNRRAEKLYKDSQKYVVQVTTEEETASVEETIAGPNTETETKNLYEDIVFPLDNFNYDAIHSINPDNFGWIVVPSVAISYPLLKGTDNEYYLQHAYNGEFSWDGSIFLDYRQDIGLEKQHSYIYGHNMQHGTMFAALLQFDDRKFFEKQKEKNNHYFFIYLKDRVDVYEIFSVADIEHYDGSLYGSYDMIKGHELYDTGIEFDKDDTLVTLYTCQVGGQSAWRHLVTGKRVKQRISK